MGDLAKRVILSIVLMDFALAVKGIATGCGASVMFTGIPAKPAGDSKWSYQKCRAVKWQCPAEVIEYNGVPGFH